MRYTDVLFVQYGVSLELYKLFFTYSETNPVVAVASPKTLGDRITSVLGPTHSGDAVRARILNLAFISVVRGYKSSRLSWLENGLRFFGRSLENGDTGDL